LNAEFVQLEFDLAEISSNGLLRGFSNNSDGTDTAGDGVLDAVLNPNGEGVNRGTLESIIFSKDPSDINPAGGYFFIYVDDIEFESPVVDPVPPPTIIAPIVAGDPSVTVTDLVSTVDQVVLFRDGIPISTNAVASPADLVIPLAPPAIADEVYTATQRSGVSGITSDLSAPVTVFPDPSPYTFSLLLDESGSGSCAFDPPGWEWVGVTGLEGSWGPQGQFLFTDDSQWQTIDVPLNDNDLVIANFGGSGSLGDSPTGFYTIDSVWFSIPSNVNSNNLGPWEVFVDAVQVVDSNGIAGETILDMEDGINRLKNLRGQSPVQTFASALSTITSYDGLASELIQWSFPSTDPTLSLGLLQRVEFQCGTSAEVPDTAQAIRFHMLLRGQPTSPLLPIPEVVGPIIVGNQDTVRVINDAAATSVELFINGESNGLPITPAGTQTDFSGLTLTPGDSVSAKQTLPGGVSDFAYPRVVTDLPPAPTVVGPLFPGALSVTVTDIINVPFASATYVLIFKNGTDVDSNGQTDVIGSAQVTSTGLATQTQTVDIMLGGPLQEGDLIYASQTVDSLTFGPVSDPVVVGIPGPTLYKAPAQFETSVRVLDINTNASLVKVLIDGTTNGSAAPGGATSVDVPVPSLIQGQVITARIIVDGAPSGFSDPETVTTNITTDIVCDDFESYIDQTAFEASLWAPTAGDVFQMLTNALNSTPGGMRSLFAPVTDNTRVERIYAPTIPTAEQPVVLTANIFDPAGGGSGNQWVDANGDLVDDFFLLEVGMASCCASTTFYNLRLNGNGGPNWVNLDDFDGPTRSVGWRQFTIVHKGDFVDAYVDGLLAKKNIPLSSPTQLEVSRIGSGLTAGNEAYYDDYCLTVGPARFPALDAQVPNPPVVQSPILDGDNVVTIADVDTNANSVTVYDAGALVIGTHTITPADSNGVVDITLTRSLVHLERINASQTNTIGESTLSADLEVGDGNGDVLIAIGIREASNAIEWIGVSTTGVGGSPQGVAISPANAWQTLTFDPTSDPVTGFTGNGMIDGAVGVLEHLAVTVNAASGGRSSGTYRLFVDNIENVGGSVITDFEGFALDSEVVFQEPTFSGTTSGNLSFPPSASANSDIYNNGGTRSQLLTWFFSDTDESRWARITTSTAANLPSPLVDLTLPIRMDVLLVAGCPTTKGDTDGDGDVDVDDHTGFAACAGGPVDSAGPVCICADVNDDGRVDLFDAAQMQDLIGG